MEITVNTPGATPALLEKQIEAPKEIKEMTFNVDTMPSLDGSGTTITTDKGVELKEEPPKEKIVETPPPEKKEEVKQVEQSKKEEAKKEEPKTKVEEPKKEEKNKIKQITPIKEKKEEGQDNFDYTKYTQQEQTNMKNMSRQSREAYAKLIDDNKQLSGLKDANYLQHELGYTLTPEYTGLRTRESAVFNEGKAWENALLAIKAGKDFKEPIGIDEKTGRLIMSEVKKANDSDEIRITQNLNLCVGELNKVRGEIGSYGTQFQNRIKTDIQEIQNERANRFAWVSDPKLLDANVEIDGKDIPVKTIIEHFKALLPPYHRNSIIADVAADLFVALQIQNNQLREAQKGTASAEIKAKEAARAEPTSDDNNRNGNGETIKTKNGNVIPRTFTLEGMPS